MKAQKNTIHYWMIEQEAEKYEGTAADYFLLIWNYLLKKENKKSLDSIARTLNVYPHPANVLNAIKFELLKHIGGTYEKFGEVIIVNSKD